jgi:hypothetical protein
VRLFSRTPSDASDQGAHAHARPRLKSCDSAQNPRPYKQLLGWCAKPMRIWRGQVDVNSFARSAWSRRGNAGQAHYRRLQYTASFNRGHATRGSFRRNQHRKESQGNDGERQAADPAASGQSATCKQKPDPASRAPRPTVAVTLASAAMTVFSCAATDLIADRKLAA